MGRLSFWVELSVRHVLLRPFWYTDKYGIAMQLFPEDNIAAKLDAKSHFYPESTLMMVRRVLNTDMTVIDVGAHHGEFTLFAAGLIGEGGCVYAFEPSEYSFGRLQTNVRKCDAALRAFRLENKAVGNKTGVAQFYEYPRKYSGWNSLSDHVMIALGGDLVRPSSGRSVPTITLDDYCAEHAVEKIDLLKIDVEGYEIEVLQGCQRLVDQRRIASIVFEISIEPLRGIFRKPGDVVRAFEATGFDVSLIGSEGRLLPVNMAADALPDFADYYAILRED
jgi:FkbM family methyltransferase